MPKPDFIIAGAAKSGTTSLARYLSAHPKIKILGERLEFFGEYSNPRFRGMNAQAYAEMMNSEENDDYVVGEKSVSYLYSHAAVDDIAAMVPNTKIIVVLRNPVDRAYSDYWHRVRTGVENLQFSEALDAEAKRIASGARFELHYATYGLYADRLRDYIARFGRDSVLILFYEDLKDDPLWVTESTFKFLGVSPSTDGIDFVVHNKGGNRTSLPVRLALRIAQNKSVTETLKWLLPSRLTKFLTAYLVRRSSVGKYPDMKPEDKDRLIRFFDASISELEQMTGRELTKWRSK